MSYISNNLFYGGFVSTGNAPPKPPRSRDKPLPEGWRVKKKRNGDFVAQQKIYGLFWKTHTYLISDWLTGGIPISYTFSTWSDAAKHIDRMA